MVADTIGDHDIKDVGSLPRTPGDAGVYHQVRPETVNQGNRADSGIDLADAGLHYGDFIVTHPSPAYEIAVDGGFLNIFYEREEHLKLTLHGYDYSNLHKQELHIYSGGLLDAGYLPYFRAEVVDPFDIRHKQRQVTGEHLFLGPDIKRPDIERKVG